MFDAFDARGLGENVAADYRCCPQIMALSDYTHYALTHTQEELGLKRLRTLMWFLRVCVACSGCVFKTQVWQAADKPAALAL